MKSATISLYQQVCTKKHLLTRLQHIVTFYPRETSEHLLLQFFRRRHLPQLALLDVPFFASLLKRDLSGYDLHGADFTSLDLSHFNLRDTRLSEANLCYADLRHADLCHADISGAKLYGVDLSDAQCQELIGNKALLEFACLQRSDFTDAHLFQACLNGVQAQETIFYRAKMECAQVRRAKMQHANMIEAHCSHSDWRDTSLQEATLCRADFSFCDVRGICVKGADLSWMKCQNAQFGATLDYDACTIISQGSHALISMMLLTHADTVEKEQFALYVMYKENFCWGSFVRLLLRRPPELIKWAKQTLETVESVRETVLDFAEHYQQDSHGDSETIRLADISQALHDFINNEYRKNAPQLCEETRYAFLVGLLTAANQQTPLGNFLYNEALQRLCAFVALDSSLAQRRDTQTVPPLY